jgi:teichuronic acid biosynthesis glycosyltransferase TuaC
VTKPIRVLLFSSLYPSNVRPIHGIFVETRLRELIKTGRVQAKVVAPVPWFPFTGARFGEYGLFAATPNLERRNGLEVHHPRYLLPPKVGMNVSPYTMALGALATIRKLQRDGFDFDLIDAHYYYPDGVAASLLAKWLGKPFVVTARGTDLNLIPQHAYPRKLIVQTAQQARASIGVCQALMDTLRDLGGEPGKLHTLRNGVDLQRFVPESRSQARQRLGLPEEGRLLLSVGHLIERKGHHIAIDALPLRPGARQAAEPGEPPWCASTCSLRGCGAADRAEMVVQRSKCARPVLQSRRLGQCIAGGHGVWHTGHRYQHLGYA